MEENPIFSKFQSYRPNQREAIDEALIRDELATFIEGPTGVGKSIIGMTIARESSPSLYLCTTKTLQDQLTRDFGSIPILKGRANYPCNKFGGTADDCLLSDDDDKEERDECKSSCPYELAKRTALRSPLAILNTSYYLTECNYVGKFKGRATVVIDEADRLEDTILRFAELSITDRLLNRLSMDLPKHVTVYDSWLDWANRNLPRVTQQRELLAKSIKSGHRDNIKLFKSVDNLYNKLSDFENLVTSDWIYQDTVTKYGLRYSFRPVWVSDLCSRLFWSHASRFVLMSATILNAEDMAYTLGIYHDYHFQQLPSLFDPSRRQVIYRPAANLTRNTMTEELPKAIAEVQRILDAHPNSKGLIHTVSYSNAKYLTDTIKSPRFVTHDGSLSRQDILDNFKQSTQPLVLVSPSMDRGIDLPDDECRFIIILKVPFPYLGDKQVKQRFWSGARGKRWYEWMTACTIVQMTGRGMRHDQDQCTSYILDRQFERFYGKSGSLFPKWWSDSLTVE